MHLPAPLVAEVDEASVQLCGVVVVRVSVQLACKLGDVSLPVGPNLGNDGLLEPGNHVAQQK
eukprot:12907486-Prorocentrum_lima.AAC.1